MDKNRKSKLKKNKLTRLVRLFNSAPGLWLLGPSGLVLAKDTQPVAKARPARKAPSRT